MLPVPYYVVVNDDTEAVPPFGIMLPVDVVDGVIHVTRPTTDNQTDVLLNGPVSIPAGQSGQGHNTFPTMIGYDFESDGTGPDAGDEWGVEADSWFLQTGKTGFAILGGAGEGVVNVLKKAGSGGGGGGTIGATGQTSEADKVTDGLIKVIGARMGTYSFGADQDPFPLDDYTNFVQLQPTAAGVKIKTIAYATSVDGRRVLFWNDPNVGGHDIIFVNNSGSSGNIYAGGFGDLKLSPGCMIELRYLGGGKWAVVNLDSVHWPTLTSYAVICGGYTTDGITGALQPVASVGTSGQVLTSNGAGALPSWSTPASPGTGTVTSVGLAMTGAAFITISGSPVTTTGTLTGTWTGTTGDTLYASASNVWSKLGIGTVGQVLTVVAGVPSWAGGGAGGGAGANFFHAGIWYLGGMGTGY